MSNSNTMQIRIAHQLALLISGCVVIAVLAVGAISIWNLSSGFQDYLQLRDQDQLDRLVLRIRQRATAEPSLDWLRNNRNVMQELTDGFNPLGSHPMGHLSSGLTSQSTLDDLASAQVGTLNKKETRSITKRVFISDPHGIRLAGLDALPAQIQQTRTIQINGKHLCTIVLAAEHQPEGLDTYFLKRQYQGLVGSALVAMLVAVSAAWWFAQRWSQPLRELQTATRRIAAGELQVHIPEHTESRHFRSGAIEIDQLISNVNTMATALAHLEAARRRWIAEISHELRTPLAVLRGELEAIEDGARLATPAVIASLHEDVMQLTRLVDDLHTLAIADLGKIPCDFREGSVNSALRRIANRFAMRAQTLNLQLTVTQPIEETTAMWDFGRIDQLISNLLENSLRYTHAPGHIHVQWKHSGPRVSVQIEDSAPGVDPAHWQRLFEPLFRMDSSRTRTNDYGSGLGLSIVKAIVQSHGGRIQVNASPLGGLMMQIELPLDPLHTD